MSFRNLITGGVLALAVSACATGERADWHDHDFYSGWVTDAATGEPIEGAVVVAVWKISWPNLLEGSTQQVIRLEETFTNKQGRFQFAPLGNHEPPHGSHRTDGEFPKLAFFKPGYEPTYRDRVTWENEDFAGIPREKRPPPARKIGWQREIRLYKYLTSPAPDYRATDPIYTRLTDETKILGRITNFASSLSENVDASDDDDWHRRKAVHAQWHAILMVDGEIRKYQPRYSWGTHEIREALAPKQDKPSGRGPIRAKSPPPAPAVGSSVLPAPERP